MPNKCCVPGCKSNYKSVREGYIPVFTFPSDPALKKQWIQSIPRKNWTCTKNSVVCLKHFAFDSISNVEHYKDAEGQWKEFPRSRSKLLPSAVPSVFSSLPSHLNVKRSGRRRRKQRCDAKESSIEQGIRGDCDDIFHGINERQLSIMEAEIQEENARNERKGEEYEKEFVKILNEPFEEIDIKDESIFDDNDDDDDDDDEEEYQYLEEEEKVDPLSFFSNVIQDAGGDEDACQPFASVTVTPSEDTIIAEGQLQVDPLADNRTVRWKRRARRGRTVETERLRQKRFECDVCNKTFKLSLMLVAHKRIHSGDLSYECDVCKKKFHKMSRLLTHSRRHSGEKPYACDTCNKAFVDSSALRKHERIHSGVKPYGCDTCLSRFTQLSALYVHVRTHLGIKPYECNKCLKRFTQLSSLKHHQRIHSGYKPFECDVCCKTFNKKSNLVVHARIHTGEKPYECHVCQRKFSLLSSVRKHLKVHRIGSSTETL